MFYEKRGAYPKPRRMAVDFTGFTPDTVSEERGLNFQSAPVLENLFGEGSVLKNGPGIAPLSLLKNPAPLPGAEGEIAHYRRYDAQEERWEDRLVVWGGAGKPLYWYDLNSGSAERKQLSYTPFSARPSFINYRLDGEDVLLVSSTQDSLAVVSGESAEAVEDAPRINSMCVHGERLFATDAGEGVSLWFSDDLDPRNWSMSLNEAGFIQILGERGRLLKAVAFADYVYVFRAYGISRASGYGDQTQFAVHDLFTSTGRILAESVTAAEDRILYLTEEGLYRFDGLSAQKVETGFSGLFPQADFSNLACAYSAGKYYAAFSVPFPEGGETGMKNNVLLVYDLNRAKATLCRGLDVASIVPVNMDGKTVTAVLYRSSGELKLGEISTESAADGVPLYKKWSTPYLDFGQPAKRKLLKKLTFYTDTDAHFTVETDGHAKQFSVSGRQENQSVRLDLSCVRARLTFSPQGAVTVCGGFRLELEVLP